MVKMLDNGLSSSSTSFLSYVKVDAPRDKEGFMGDYIVSTVLRIESRC